MEKPDLFDDQALMQSEANPDSLFEAHSLLASNVPRGLAELEALASKGSVLAMLYLAHACTSKVNDLVTAEKWYRAAYERGSSTALFNLGVLYGRIGKYAEAEKIFLDGVSKADARAMFGLAKLYLGRPRRESEAVALLERAAALGQFRARIRLSRLLMNGKYGLGTRVRGLWLFLSGIPIGINIARRDPHSPRL